MKAKAILLSGIILGGFAAPVISTKVVSAEEVQMSAGPQVETNQIKLGSKFDLKDLTIDTKVAGVAFSKLPSNNPRQKFGEVIIPLNQKNVDELKSERHQTKVSLPEINITDDWGGKFIFFNTENTTLIFDEGTNSLMMLDPTTGKPEKDINDYVTKVGAAHIEYYKDKTQAFKYAQEGAYTPDRNVFEVDTALGMGKQEVGHFDIQRKELLKNGTWKFTPYIFDYDPSIVTHTNRRYAVYMRPAQPVKIDVKVFLDGREYSSNSMTKNVFEKVDSMEKVKLPTSEEGIVDNSKFKLTHYNSFNTTTNQKIFTGEENAARFDMTNGDYFGHLFNNLATDNDKGENDPTAPAQASLTNGVTDEKKHLVSQTYSGMNYKYEIHYKTPSKEVSGSLTISSNKGDQIVDKVTGEKGKNVQVKVPDIEGYTPDKETVTAHINDEGSITTNDKVVYSQNEMTADVTIKSNKGPQVVKAVTGKVDETIFVDVPKLDGYTADKTKIKAKVNPNGTITALEEVYYTKEESSQGNNNGNNNGNGNEGNEGNQVDPGDENDGQAGEGNSSTPEKYDGLVATKKRIVNLYSLEKNKMTNVEKRNLAAHSDWKATGKVTIDGITYYQVSTNEWVKASEVYRYEYLSSVVTTHKGKLAQLKDSDNVVESHRGLQENTRWLTDRIAYLGDNETPHYRVSTNQFVSVDHVTLDK
ncbi:SLAP domain-containing protein [Companilactobacillus sp.]|uniref:SLAP domain-containing protein n=1 Tax=Companilactobacillus sp. TaxID=2767905 RepID=UPI002603431F|nr:SLAP domain-containing protein [Companilactobacillus sp.]